jgi:pyruvate kinase
MPKTKIVANLGPGTKTVEKIVTLIQAGMNVARINLSHGDRASHALFIQRVKDVLGIIAEQPGLTSHAAIVGLEFEIPVVCNVSGATELFKNDQMVSINGTSGHISYGRSKSL